MISDRSCDTDDWINDAKNSALHHRKKKKKKKIEIIWSLEIGVS